MSTDDPKNALSGLDDDDWGSALDDWEKNAFTPSIAPAVESAVAKDHAGSTPPDAPAEEKPPAAVEVTSETQETPLPPGFGPEPATKPAHERAVLDAEEKALAEARAVNAVETKEDLGDKPSEAAPPAMVAEAAKSTPVPPKPSVPPPPQSSRGGLGQLFSRASSPSFHNLPPSPPTDVGPVFDKFAGAADVSDADETLIRQSKPPPAPLPVPLPEAPPIPKPPDSPALPVLPSFDSDD